MPEEHAKLSASGSKKWINCPASITMESKFPDESSEYAKEGTTAHSLGEAKLKLALNHITRVQYHKMIRSLDITEDMEEEEASGILNENRENIKYSGWAGFASLPEFNSYNPDFKNYIFNINVMMTKKG